MRGCRDEERRGEESNKNRVRLCTYHKYLVLFGSL